MSDTSKQPTRREMSFKTAAREYVNAQLDTMEKYGSAPILALGEYEGLVQEMTQIGRKLWLASGGKICE